MEAIIITMDMMQKGIKNKLNLLRNKLCAPLSKFLKMYVIFFIF